MKTTVGKYLLDSVKAFNIHPIFGVPGDYNLFFLDQVIEDPDLVWMGDTNELNAGYAAAAYASVHGISALVTTGGVGELSATNAIAGAFVEHSPIIHIVGHPSLPAQADKKLIHHMPDETVTAKYLDIAKNFTVAQAVLTRDNAAYEVPRVLQEIYRKKLPGYIAIPSGESAKEIEAQPFTPSYPASDPAKLDKAVSQICEKLKASANPVAMVDLFVKCFLLQTDVTTLIEKQQLPFAQTLMGRGAISELHDNYLGIYMGDKSAESTRQRVENADLLLCLGGFYQADYNTGYYSQNFSKITTVIKIQPNSVMVNDTIYTDVWLHDVIRALNKKQQIRPANNLRSSAPKATPLSKYLPQSGQRITQARFWECMQQWIGENHLIVTEVGTAIWAALGISLKKNVDWLGSKLWASIGYATPAVLGACAADPTRKVVAFIGDGSFQLTAQAIATMLRHRQTPVIFLLNNDGYTIERIIHGEKASYNDVAMWNYPQFAESLTKDPTRVWSTSVSTEEELQTALTSLPKDKLVFIEVLMERMDYPSLMDDMFKKKPKVSLYDG